MDEFGARRRGATSSVQLHYTTAPRRGPALSSSTETARTGVLGSGRRGPTARAGLVIPGRAELDMIAVLANPQLALRTRSHSCSFARSTLRRRIIAGTPGGSAHGVEAF